MEVSETIKLFLMLHLCYLISFVGLFYTGFMFYVLITDKDNNKPNNLESPNS